MSAEPSDVKYPWIRRSSRVRVGDGSAADFEYTIAPFDSKNLPVARDVAFLHRTLLPTSPASKLGPEFLEAFYYKVLVEDGHVFGCVAYVDGEPAALWVGAEDSNGFMRRAFRRRFIRLGIVLSGAVLTDPRRIGGILEAIRLMGARRHSGEKIGESLSLAVMPVYRGREFKRRTGVHLARELSNTGHAEFCRRNVPTVRMVVDKDNIRNQRFCEQRGWKLLEGAAEGWKIPSLEYRISPSDIARD